MKLIKTKMMNRYLLRLLLRVVIFLSMLIFYIFKKQMLWGLITGKVVMGISPIHVLWMLFMTIMIAHLFPNEKRSMALRKSDKQYYSPVDNYSEINLLRFVKLQNLKAWKVMLVWLIFNGFIGASYLFGITDEADLFMITVFFFLCDYICILFFCPFQTYIMGNKCCVNCRIYDWGHFMMFTPMLFIRNFFSWSLFFTSLIVLINWEIRYAKNPERFWFGSNKTLQCSHCQDKTCQMKRALAKKPLITEE